MAAPNPYCFTLRDTPHRIEISEGDPFDAAELMQAGFACEGPLIIGGLDVCETEISEIEYCEGDALAMTATV
jgi:hypothetical protein